MKGLSIGLLTVFGVLFLFSIVPTAQGNDYNVPQDYTASKNEIEVLNVFYKLCRDKGIDRPIWDPSLSVAMQMFAKQITKSGMDETEKIQNRHIAAAIRGQGGTDSAIRVQMANYYRTSDIKKVLESELLEDYKNGKFTHIGIAVDSKPFPPTKYMAVVVSRRPVTLAPFPRKVMPGQEYYLKGTMNQQVEDLTIILADPEGSINRIKPEVKANGTFSTFIPFDSGGGKYTIEVQATGTSGPEISNLFFVESLAQVTRKAEREPIIPVPDMPPTDTAYEAEVRLFSLINLARQAKSKGRLTRNDKLDRVAREYAKEMISRKFIGHVNPDGEDVSFRVKKAGVEYKAIAENVAVNETVIQAHKNLMSSPAHAQMVLEGRFSQVGIGVAFKTTATSRSVYVVEIFLDPR